MFRKRNCNNNRNCLRYFKFLYLNIKFIIYAVFMKYNIIRKILSAFFHNCFKLNLNFICLINNCNIVFVIINF